MVAEHAGSHYGFDPAKALPCGVDLSRAGFMPLQKNETFDFPNASGGLLLLAAAQGSGEIAFDGGWCPVHAQDAALFGQPGRVTARAGASSTLDVYYAILLERIGFAELLPALREPFGGALVLERLSGCVSDARSGRALNRYQRADHAFGLLTACCEALDGGALSAYPPLVINALGIIEEEYPYIFGVAEIAESLEVSKHHLIREFTKALGVSPGKKLAQTRVHHAKKLLLEREYTVEIVGQMVGYANGNYFCKVFHDHTGMSPKEYRNMR